MVILSTLFQMIQAQDHPTVEAQIDSILKPLVKEFPGFSCVVSKQGKIAYSKGFGYSDLEKKLPFTDSTTFNLYSISKTFTGVALAKMAEEKLMDINESIISIDNTLPIAYREITPRLLISHMSGVRHYNGDWLDFASKPCKDTNEAIQFFISDNLNAKPGTKAIYSTFGYVLLSHLIEVSFELGYEEYLEQKIFNISEMTNTYLDGSVENDSQRAKAYYLNQQTKGLDTVFGIYNNCKYGGGGFVTTTLDLIRFSNALIGHKILDGISFKNFYTPIADPMLGLIKEPESAKDGYAMGIEYHKVNYGGNDTFYLSHGGASIGGNSYLLMYPNEGLVIALGGNFNGDGFETAAKNIAKLLL